MCGIFGILQPEPLSGRELQRMSQLLRHRGPDDEGFLVAHARGMQLLGGVDTPNSVLAHAGRSIPPGRVAPDWRSPPGVVALGHRRLSIVDLSAHGHQPMCYRDRYWIIFNGEVYNYLELRTELAALGHEFASVSDTEVILAAYAEWGPACLTRFNGMWGLAIYDAGARTLFIARDRFGVKPVYYRVANDGFVFASEIKAFSALPGWQAQRNDARLLDYLAWNVLDHTPETFFRGVQQLPAGHYFLIETNALQHGGGVGCPA